MVRRCQLDLIAIPVLGAIIPLCSTGGISGVGDMGINMDEEKNVMELWEIKAEWGMGTLRALVHSSLKGRR